MADQAPELSEEWLNAVDELVRKVSRAICLRVQGNDFGQWDEAHELFNTTGAQIDLLGECCDEAARAAIAVVVEEAAKVADKAYLGLWQQQGERVHSMYSLVVQDSIRALNPKER